MGLLVVVEDVGDEREMVELDRMVCADVRGCWSALRGCRGDLWCRVIDEELERTLYFGEIWQVRDEMRLDQLWPDWNDDRRILERVGDEADRA